MILNEFFNLPQVFEFAPGDGGNAGDYLRTLASAWYNDVYNTGNLQKGIKSQQDVEKILSRGVVCPDGKTRRYYIDYNGDFNGVELISHDYYEHSDYGDNGEDVDGRTGQPWSAWDHIEYSDNDLDEGVTEGESFSDMWKQNTKKKKPSTPTPGSFADMEKQNKQHQQSQAKKKQQQGVAEGIETIYGRPYDVDPNKYYVWAWDSAVVLYGEYDNIKNAKINLPKIEKRAIERLGPYVKSRFELSTGKELLQRYGKKDVAEGHADQQRKIFKKNGKPVGEVGIDRESSPGHGQWYMTCYGVVSYGGYDSYEEAVEELKHCLKQKQGMTEGHADQQRKIFKKNGKPVGEVGIDRESSPGHGQWYMKCYAYNIDN